MTKLIDKLFDPVNKISYRRLLAWGVSTWLVYEAKIDSESWMWVTIAFIAGESAKHLWSPSKKAVESTP